MSDNEDNGGGNAKEQSERFLPIANIARIMKKQLPSNAKIAKDAKEVRRSRLSLSNTHIDSSQACNERTGRSRMRVRVHQLHHVRVSSAS